MKKKTLQLGWGLALAWLLVTPCGVHAQEKFETTVGADLVSAYRWRGQNLGGFSVQPGISVAKSGFSLTAWSSIALDRSGDSYTDELDFTLGYSIGGFSVAVTDYFCIAGDFGSVKYFMYEAHKTAHVFEATLAYDFGPVALCWNTNFAGSDYFKNGGTKRSYSTYLEASAPFKLGGVDFKVEVGATPWYGAYDPDAGNGFRIVNTGLTASKEIKIADFVLPVFAKIGANPQTEEAYAVFGVSF